MSGYILNELFIQQLGLHQIGPISLTIQPAETMSLSGPSGVGKSILLRAIVDLIPHTGEVSYAGQTCAQTRPNVWRTQIGLLPAESHWWCDQVGQHFNDLNERQKSWFSALGLDENVLKWQLSRCSTGERQRLALLRLLCHGPKVLLLDEPTANLDPDMTSKVEAVIKNYQAEYQVPVLWVTHDQQQASRIADRQLVLNQNGQLEEVSA